VGKALAHLAGLGEYLQGEPRSITNIYHLDGAGLWFLPAGKPPENPLELMQSGQLSGLLDQLTAGFDWIIIDSPPILPLADTSVWTRFADGVLQREGDRLLPGNIRKSLRTPFSCNHQIRHKLEAERLRD